jgi:hypothetical protein
MECYPVSMLDFMELFPDEQACLPLSDIDPLA